MKLRLDRVQELAEGADLEVKAALGRDGRGELPKSFWETYSAMANTDGGVVLLGISETAKGVFQVIGLTDAAKVQKALWDGVNSRDQISVNLLKPDAVQVAEVEGRRILRILIPRARRNQRPVYVGRNPLTGTYQRSYEGDYRCDSETVRRMLAEQVEDERDGKILHRFTLADLDSSTLNDYRNAVRTAKPTLSWHEFDDQEFLRALGAWRHDRETAESGVTLGGLLMFGRLPSIQEAVPNYMLDYQERPAPKREPRWLDRLTTDGEWSGNLFDFCRMVLKRLYKDLPVPFQLSGATRVDETPVHVALREALVNTLIHADFSGRVSILVVKRPDLFGFRNPGCMRIGFEDALAGGNSDCRNRVLQRLFRMAGYAEQAGYGIPTIYSGWRKQLWQSPILRERRQYPEQTFLTMSMLSLLSEETVAALETRFGARYRKLSETQQMALATVAVEGTVSHARLKTMVYDHPRDITAALSSLCREGFLESAGVARGTYYFFPGEPPDGEGPLLFDPEAQPAASSEHLEGSSEHLAGSSEHLGDLGAESSEHLEGASSEHLAQLLEIARPVRESGKAPRLRVEAVLTEVCQPGYRTLRELQAILGRDGDFLRVHYLNRMVKDGRMRLRFPEAPNHPNQAYTSAP
jgi:ATP-dependent DNA helicase RecG